MPCICIGEGGVVRVGGWVGGAEILQNLNPEGSMTSMCMQLQYILKVQYLRE